MKAQQSAVPQPFAQNAQYIRNSGAAEEEHDGQAEVPTKRQKKNSKKKKKRRPAQISVAKKIAEAGEGPPDSKTIYEPHVYGEKRKSFIYQLMEEGYSWKNAKDEWDKSSTKGRLLAPVPLPELKRRRFVDKSCKEHPWASYAQG